MVDNALLKAALDKVILEANGDGCFHIHPDVLVGMAVVKIQPSWEEYLQVREQARNYLSANSITDRTLKMLLAVSPTSCQVYRYLLKGEGYCFNPYHKGEDWHNDEVLLGLW